MDCSPPGSSVREGSGNPPQNSCLENPVDRGAWWVAVHGVAQSRTWLKRLSMHACMHALEKEMATHSSILAWETSWTEKPAATAAKSLQPCLTLCNPINGTPPGVSVPGILQARTLEWVAISFSNACMHAKSLQSCPTLCDPMDCNPPGSSVHRILQARILEWVAISFSKKSMIQP